MIVKTGTTKVKTKISPDTVVVVPQSQTYNAAGVPQGAPFGGGNLTVKEHEEYIRYSTRRKAERYLPNSCDHSKFLQYYSGDATSYYKVRAASPNHTNGWYVMYTGGHTSIPHLQSIDAARSALGIGSNPNLSYSGNPQDDIDLNYWKLKPDLTQLSLPNFLLELDDVSKLWVQAKKNVKLARDLMGKNVRSGDTAKTLAGNHLSWKFGLAPAMADISAMRAILQRLIAKLHAFNKMAGQIFTSDIVLEDTVLTKAGSFNYVGNVQIPVKWQGTMQRTKMVGAVYRALPLKTTGGYIDILRALMDSLGFELNPRILWDAIPFSFVLDWFFGVGSWLESHKHDTLELPVAYMGSYVSCKHTVTIHSSFIQNRDDLITDAGRRVWPGWVTQQRRFIRIPVGPTESIFTGLGWRLPTLNQAMLSVSLGTVLKK